MKIPQMVFELQSGHDSATDRRTDRRPGQKQYVSQPYGRQGYARKRIYHGCFGMDRKIYSSGCRKVTLGMFFPIHTKHP